MTEEECIRQWISRHYFDGDKTEGTRPRIFRHIYDVAWQCVLARSIDFLYGRDGPSKQGRNWITNLQCHAALGREFYQLALEVHYDQSQSAYHYLLIVVHQLERLFEDKPRWSELDPKLQGKLQEWGGCDQDKLVRNQIWLDKHTAKFDDLFGRLPPRSMSGEDKRKDFNKEAKEIARRHTALDWRDFYGWFRHHGLEFYSGREVDPDSSSQQYEERLRTLEKVLRRKLNQLIDIFREYDKNYGLKSGDPIYPLFSYLESTRLAERESTDERMQRLIEALRPNRNSHVPDYYLIGRIAIAGSYPTQGERSEREEEPDQKEGPDRMAYWLDRFKTKQGYRWDGERTVCRPLHEVDKSGQHGNRYYQAVSGRYDLVSWIKTRPMCRCTLPEFPQPDPTEPKWEGEKFPAFFIRREQAVPVRLNPKRPFPNEDMSVLAILSVTLTQRYARIDALSRLLRAWDNCAKDRKNASDNEYEKLQIEQVVRWLDADKDRLFLTDGWDDLLFIFSGEPSEKRLREVFAIQGAFFEDFMVDRTELMLAADYIPIAAASSEFQLSVQLRLMEDRTLGYENSEFREQVEANIENPDGFWHALPRKHIALCRTPGRTDYTMTFPNLDKYLNAPSLDPKSRSFEAGRLFELFQGIQIDAIQTTIGRKIR